MQDKTFLFIGLSALIHVSVIGGFIAQTKMTIPDEQGSSALDVEITEYKKTSRSIVSKNQGAAAENSKQQAVVHSAKPATNKPAEMPVTDDNKITKLSSLKKSVSEQLKQSQKNTADIAGEQPEKANATQANAQLLESIIRTELSRHFYYPKLAQRRNWQGLVLLGYTVTASGTIEKIRVSKSSGFQVLDEAAITALKKVDATKEMAVATNGFNVDQILPVKYSLVE